MTKTKRTKAPSKPTRKPEDPDQRAKHLQRLAEYRSRPEAREKQRLLMAESRAAAKAHRRQWDPPKKIKLVPHDTDSPMAYVSPEQPLEPAPPMDCQIVGDASITSAEHLAIGRRRLHRTRKDRIFHPTIPCFRRKNQIHLLLPTIPPLKPLSKSPSGADASTKLSPPKNSRLTSLRSTHCRRKSIGSLVYSAPLTWVQQFQMHVATLADSGSSIDDVEDVIAVDDRGPSFLTMSTQRWEQVWEWRQGIENDTEWDADAQRGFAEAALLARR
ncbi:hypothetical protein C8F04DRAFT_1197583 [Mycena alexandri]|uniref:Uncharacterized protein n=1 Tax=Mycena alexandri TaxID=1745969 RepID=A0AAD6S2Y9_9AGAR|nr:hypothetical protein C8F04DRAFT_1197583 [Mycena alexandri]